MGHIEIMAINNLFPKDSIKKLKGKLEQKRTETKDRKQEKTEMDSTHFSPLVRKFTSPFKDTEIKITYRSTNTIYKQLAKKQIN